VPGTSLAQWAAAHAATVTRGCAPPLGLRLGRHPVRAASFGEVRAWTDGDRVLAVAAGRRADGRLVLATGGRNDYAVRLWDPQTGELLSTLTGHTGDIGLHRLGVLARQTALAGFRQPRRHRANLGSRYGAGSAQLSGHGLRALSVAWGYLADGRPQLATSGDGRENPDMGPRFRCAIARIHGGL